MKEDQILLSYLKGKVWQSAGITNNLIIGVKEVKDYILTCVGFAKWEVLIDFSSDGTKIVEYM